MKEVAFLSARLAWRVANDDQWPVTRPTREEVAQSRDEYDKKEVRRIEEEVEILRVNRT